ncbi:MAG: GEVED domain-containing protein [Cytophagaceae bacterium]|nr:GEVED domain-containing protein [Cytophagaceae bacterium]
MQAVEPGDRRIFDQKTALDYCQPAYFEGCASAMGLNTFAIEGTSLNNSGSGCSSNGFANYTTQGNNLTATLAGGQTYTFQARSIHADNGSAYNDQQHLSIWIDVNHDGNFTPDERVYSSTNSGSSMSAVLRAQFVIPANAQTGPTRMRVRTRDLFEEKDDPCWQYFYGETEDYTVNINGNATPPPPTGICLDLRILLEGPFQEGSNTMQTMLNDRGLLPGQTPKGQFGVATPPGQPYNTAPWNYNGPESTRNYDADVVDWVLVSLRTDGGNVGSVVYRSAGLLRSDGRITMPGNCPTLATDKAYHIVVEHRNHLGVMSAAGVRIDNGKLTYDFTSRQSFATTDPPSSGQLQLGSRFVLFSADGQKDPSVQNFDINFNDADVLKTESGLFDRYLRGDYNLDADVNFNDQIFWKRNSGRYSTVAH